VDDELRWQSQVKYQPERVVGLFDNLGLKNLMTQNQLGLLLTTKFKDWEYEWEYLNEHNARMNAEKSVFEHVAIDSAVEWEFADQLEKNNAVKVYAKLPSWFKVPTPLGSYNADWAVLIERDGHERPYFVVETKSSLFDEDLRDREG
jgi:restriction endonuclease